MTNLRDGAEAEDFLGLEHLHVLDALRDAFQRVGDQLVQARHRAGPRLRLQFMSSHVMEDATGVSFWSVRRARTPCTCASSPRSPVVVYFFQICCGQNARPST